MRFFDDWTINKPIMTSSHNYYLVLQISQGDLRQKKKTCTDNILVSSRVWKCFINLQCFLKLNKNLVNHWWINEFILNLLFHGTYVKLATYSCHNITSPNIDRFLFTLIFSIFKQFLSCCNWCKFNRYNFQVNCRVSEKKSSSLKLYKLIQFVEINCILSDISVSTPFCWLLFRLTSRYQLLCYAVPLFLFCHSHRVTQCKTVRSRCLRGVSAKQSSCKIMQNYIILIISKNVH